MRAKVWAGLTVVLVAFGAPGASVAAHAAVPAKKAAACALLTGDEVAEIVGSPSSEARPARSVTGASVCDYETGEGLGSAGGGLVVVQVYTGKLGSTIYATAKRNNEKVGSVYWDGKTGIATTRAGKSTIATSYTVIGVDAGGNQDAVVGLAAAAAKHA